MQVPLQGSANGMSETAVAIAGVTTKSLSWYSMSLQFLHLYVLQVWLQQLQQPTAACIE